MDRLGVAVTFVPRIPLKKLDASIQSSVKGFWQFDGDLTDDSGNGLTLSTNTGTARYATLDGLQGFFPDNGQYLLRSVHDSDLTILGAWTLNVLAYFVGGDDTAEKIVDFAGAGELEANNTLYMVRQQSSTGRLQYTAEFGSGSNIVLELRTPIAVGAWHLYTLTRSSGGTTMKLYIDGVQAFGGSPSTAPTGGTTSTLSTVAALSGFYAGIMISAEEAIAATVLSQAKNVGVVVP